MAVSEIESANTRSRAEAATEEALRPHAEQAFAGELAALAAADDRPRPPVWRLSPVGGRHLPARRHAAATAP